MMIMIMMIVTTYVILQLMCLVRDAQCNENISSLFAIYYSFNCLLCILHRTAETHSVDCQSSNFCLGNIKNIPYVPSHYLLCSIWFVKIALFVIGFIFIWWVTLLACTTG